MSIPTRLQDKEYRFIKIIKNGKRPLEFWRKENKVYEWDDDELNQWIDESGNVGVLTGFGALLIIDVDDVETFTDKVSMPETFTVKSGRGENGMHMYYSCKNMGASKFKMFKDPVNKVDQIGSILTPGNFVVGPGSTHESGNTYDVVHDAPIAEIDWNELMTAIQPFKPGKAKAKKEEAKQERDNAIFEQIRAKVNIWDLYPELVPGDYSCLFHSPDEHPSMRIKPDGRFRCYADSCGRYGDVVDIVAFKEGVDKGRAIQLLKDHISGKHQLEEAERIDMTEVMCQPKTFGPIVKPTIKDEAEVLRMFLRGIRSVRNEEKGLLGEEVNAMTALLTMVSALSRQPLNLALLGTSGSGKTNTIYAVKQAIPEEWFKINGRDLDSDWSPTALKHAGQPYWDDETTMDTEPPDGRMLNVEHKIIILNDDGGHQMEFMRKIKPILSRDRFEVVYQTTQQVAGEWVSSQDKIRGYVVVIATSTTTKREAEMMGRFLTSSPQMPNAKDIMRFQDDIDGMPPDHAALKACHRYIEGLRPVNVIIPFRIAELWPDETYEQSHRHCSTLRGLVKAIALFFQGFRPRKDDNTIYATRGDVELASYIISPLIKAMNMNVSPNVFIIFERIKKKFKGEDFYKQKIMEWISNPDDDEKSIGRTSFKEDWKAMLNAGMFKHTKVEGRKHYWKIDTGPIDMKLSTKLVHKDGYDDTSGFDDTYFNDEVKKLLGHSKEDVVEEAMTLNTLMKEEATQRERPGDRKGGIFHRCSS